MVEHVMDEHELLQQLNHFYKVRLYLDEDKRQLLMRKDESASLPQPVLEAIKEHREPLLKHTHYVDALSRFDRWMDERAEQARLGSVDRAKARLAGQAGLGSDGTDDRLNQIWDSADLEAFEGALSAYMRAGARAFLRSMEAADGPNQPTLSR